MPFPFNELREGSRFSASEQNAKADELLRVSRFSGPDGASGVEGNQTFPPDTRPLLARIVGKEPVSTGLLTAYRFHLVNLQRAESSAAPLVRNDPWSTLADWDQVAFEQSGNPEVPIDGSAIIWLRPSYAN